MDARSVFWGTGLDGTQKEPKTDDSLAGHTPHIGLAITCNRPLNMNCEMASIPPELFHKISFSLLCHLHMETKVRGNERVTECHIALQLFILFKT